MRFAGSIALLAFSRGSLALHQDHQEVFIDAAGLVSEPKLNATAAVGEWSQEDERDAKLHKENELEQQAKPIFVTYHKTGTELAHAALKQCLSDTHIEFASHGDFDPDKYGRVVEFVRDPMATVRSAYLYHLESTESWLLEPDGHRGWLRDDPVCMAEYKDGENFQQYLNRVPEKIGFRAQYLQSSHSAIPTMTANSVVCANDLAGRCKQVCLEEFTLSSESYSSTWKGILEFLGLDVSLLHCLSQFDLLSHPPSDSGHVTNSAVGSSSENMAKQFVDLDAKLNDGKFTAPIASQNCAKLGSVSFKMDHLSDNVLSPEDVADAYA